MDLSKKPDSASQVSNEVPPNFGAQVTLRCKKAEYKESAKGNKMFVLEAEIIKPASWKSPATGMTYDLTGHEITYYITLSEKALSRAIETLEKLGASLEGVTTEWLDEKNDFGVFNHVNFCKTELVGKCFTAIVKTFGKKEQIKGPNDTWVDMKDEETGQVITKGFVFTNDASNIRGLAKVDVDDRF